MTITNWTLVEHGPSDFRVHGLTADAWRSTDREDGTPVRTSRVVRFNPETRMVQTESGSLYLLGAPAREGLRTLVGPPACFLLR